jgi:pimeloyl-ACP methyl ester carboxylesterase
MAVCRVGDLELYYEDLGGPPERTIVFLHGLLLSFEMMEPIARGFGERFRPVLVELHGHGRSSRPTDANAYSMRTFSDDLIAIADALGQERIAVFGTSLGADVALETMLDHPDRIAGAVLEMPVLEHGAKVARRMFRPVARALRTRYAPRALAAASRRMPHARFLPGFPEALEHLAREPAAGAAIIEGLLEDAERHRWDDVVHCNVPALVVAHAMDPLHAFADARTLAARLPNAELVRAYNILELRVRPRRLIGIASRFFERVFEQPEDHAIEA